MTSPIPEGYTSVTPYLTVPDAGEAIAFYTKAFGATEVLRMSPDGQTVWHAELRIGNAMLMIGSECGEIAQSPKTIGGTPVSLCLYMEDCDAGFKRAVDAGCTPEAEPTDAFWGDRYSKVVDPYGHKWSIMTHMHDPTPEEMDAGMKAMMAQHGS